MSKDLPVLNDANDANGASPSRQPIGIVVSVAVVLFVAFAVYLIVRNAPWTQAAGPLPASFQFDLESQLAVDPSLIRYHLQKQIDLPFTGARALASGPREQIYVAGKQAVYVLDHDGRIQKSIEVAGETVCLAVGDERHAAPGRLYAASAAGVEVFDEQGERVATWPPPNGKTVFTSIAVADEDVFFADAGNRVVWRYNAAGEQIGRIDLTGQTGRGQGGFAVPGHQFDVVVAAEDLLYVVNPGKLQIVTTNFAGDVGAAWGRASTSIDGFFGCCNPTHLAMLPDGRLATCEKGVPRVKVYRPTGELDAVVAAPEQLGVRPQSIGDPRLAEQQANFEIGVDQLGRVLVLDPAGGCIRVFVEKDAVTETGED